MSSLPHPWDGFIDGWIGLFPISIYTSFPYQLIPHFPIPNFEKRFVERGVEKVLDFSRICFSFHMLYFLLVPITFLCVKYRFIILLQSKEALSSRMSSGEALHDRL